MVELVGLVAKDCKDRNDASDVFRESVLCAFASPPLCRTSVPMDAACVLAMIPCHPEDAPGCSPWQHLATERHLPLPTSGRVGSPTPRRPRLRADLATQAVRPIVARQPAPPATHTAPRVQRPLRRAVAAAAPSARRATRPSSSLLQTRRILTYFQSLMYGT